MLACRDAQMLEYLINCCRVGFSMYAHCSKNHSFEEIIRQVPLLNIEKVLSTGIWDNRLDNGNLWKDHLDHSRVGSHLKTFMIFRHNLFCRQLMIVDPGECDLLKFC